MATKRFKLRMTQELINKAMPRDSHKCMIAQALRQQHGARSVDVTADSIRFNIDDLRYMCPTPVVAAVELIQFDKNRKKVAPFEVVLRELFTKPVRKISAHRKNKHGATPLRAKSPARCTKRRFRGLKVIEKV